MARGDNLIPYHFKPGHPGGPGRPPKSTEDRILQELSRQLDDATLTSIISATIERAKNGENKALRLLFEYLIGSPVQRSRLAVSEELADLLRNWRSKPGESSEDLEQQDDAAPSADDG
jgi:hypothetical protein